MLLEFGFEMLLFLVGLVVMDLVCCCLRWAWLAFCGLLLTCEFGVELCG